MILLIACVTDEVVSSTPGKDTDTSGETTWPSGDGCRATPTDEDRAVVLSLPYTVNGGQADDWALLWLQADGSLVDTEERFTMGRAAGGTVVFPPDGSLALAPTDDGGVAVYDTVARAVVDTFDLGIYVVGITFAASGEEVYLVDGNWPNNGGGLYRSTVDCSSGMLGEPEKILEAKLPQVLLPEGDGWWLTGIEIPGADTGADVAPLGADFAVGAGVDAFGDDDAIVSSAALADGHLLIGDINEFSGYPTRIARVDTVNGTAETFEFEDPYAMVAFPDGSSRVLVASGYGDRYAVVDAATGEETGVSASGVQLPGSLSVATWGTLRGHAFGAEVGGVRHLVLGDSVEDLGVTSLGSSSAGIVGALGVAP